MPQPFWLDLTGNASALIQLAPLLDMQMVNLASDGLTGNNAENWSSAA